MSDKFTRRDFIKLAGVGSAAAAVEASRIAKGVTKIVDKLAPEALLDKARKFLVKNEDIPDNLSSLNLPEANPEFQFADEIIIKAIDVYDKWAEANNQPPAFYDKPKTFIGFEDLESISNTVGIGPNLIDEIMSVMNSDQSVNSDILEQKISALFSKVGDLKEFKDLIIAAVDRTKNNKVIQFSEENIKDPTQLLDLNPGSSIIRTII